MTASNPVGLSRPERRRWKKATGTDPKDLWARQDRENRARQSVLLTQKCGWCGQQIGNPQFHPPPDYDCAKMPMTLGWRPPE